MFLFINTLIIKQKELSLSNFIPCLSWRCNRGQREAQLQTADPWAMSWMWAWSISRGWRVRAPSVSGQGLPVKTEVCYYISVSPCINWIFADGKNLNNYVSKDIASTKKIVCCQLKYIYWVKKKILVAILVKKSILASLVTGSWYCAFLLIVMT